MENIIFTKDELFKSALENINNAINTLEAERCLKRVPEMLRAQRLYGQAYSYFELVEAYLNIEEVDKWLELKHKYNDLKKELWKEVR